MAYIGKSPEHGTFEKQDLTADGSTTTFTLNYTVGSSSAILVSVSGVIQEPETAYNLSTGGTKIVFSAAPESGEDIFVIFLGVAFDSSTLLSSGTITGQTAETAVADDDLVLIYDTSAAALRKMTKANFAPSVSLTYAVNANLTGDGSTTGFTIGTSGRSQNDILVTVNGIVFHPSDDYTLSGTTLTFTTPPSASAEIRVRYLPITA
tara:strand:+ start:1970 stop:2590 length:621 start_codon:yes stop_codon:yes gene_type:complete